VSVLDVDVAGAGFFYIVIDYVEGKSLDWHGAHYGDARWSLLVLRQIAEGLTAIHDSGIVHRDLKPANVLLATGANGAPRAMIADFGISRLTEALGGAPSVPPPGVRASARLPAMAPQEGQDLTETGVLIGTPKYMAPELVGDTRAATAAADVFSFGVIAYELLTRESPYPQPAAMMYMNNERVPEPRPLVIGDGLGTRTLVELLRRAVSEDPSARPTAHDLAMALADASAEGIYSSKTRTPSASSSRT